MLACIHAIKKGEQAWPPSPMRKLKSLKLWCCNRGTSRTIRNKNLAYQQRQRN
jgi:hypothetical protein